MNLVKKNIVELESNGERLHQMMLAYDAFYWIDKMKINLGGEFKPFKVAGHEYQLEILQSNAKTEVTIKGAQLGISEAYVLKTLHGMIFGKYPNGALYLFPTRDDVVDFSKGRFAPLIESNPSISEYVKDTDSANIKKINGAMLYLRGARATKSIDDKKSSSQLKCHDDQTEILTRNEWKKFSELTLNDEVATRSPSGEFMWQKISHIHKYRHEGKMLYFKTRGLDFCVTPNHRILLTTAPNKTKEWFDLAENIRGDRTHIHVIRTTNNWDGFIPDFIVKANSKTGEYNFIEICGNRINSRWEKRKRNRLISLKKWVAFLGLYISEGCTEGIMSGELKPGVGRVCISQEKTSKHYDKIKQLLLKLPFKWIYNGHSFRTSDKELSILLFPMGSKYTKKLPDWVLDLPSRYLQVLWEYAVMGDGHVDDQGFVSYATVSKKLADQLQEILHKIGIGASVRSYFSDKESFIRGRLIKTKVPIYVVFARATKTSVVPIPIEIDYSGDVFCVSVPNGTTLTRRNGYTVWSGNSIPVDCIRVDERDEMDNDMVDLALERVSHSDVQEINYLGTPTVPDFGVDKLYKSSDQKVWEIKCSKCGKYTCLELTFPECLHENSDGTVVRLCQHCKDRELNPRDGLWVAQYPEKAKGELGITGRWISQLNSIYINPAKILKLFNDPPNGNIAEVYNSKLGMAYVSTENKLNKNDLYMRCGNDIMPTQHDGPCCMGVDVGNILHTVVACKTGTKALKIVKVARLSSFYDVHDLAKRFNVKCAVVDYKPEIKKARDFQASERYPVFLCNYQENRRGALSWDEKDKMVLVNRTEACDNTHDLVMEHGALELPRRNPELDIFITQMCNMAKKAVTDEDTKSIEYKYVVLGQDHFRHAMNYCWMASKRVATINDSNVISAWFNSRRRKTWKTT